MTAQLRAMGVPKERLETIVFGTDAYFLERHADSVNLLPPEAGEPPTVISTRSLDSPLYNVDLSCALSRRCGSNADAQLLVAGTAAAPNWRPWAGPGLTTCASAGSMTRPFAMSSCARIYVSMPDSDATSSPRSRDGCGCFPVLSGLPTQREWVEDGANGFLVSPGDAQASRSVSATLENSCVAAGGRNRGIVEERGLWEKTRPSWRTGTAAWPDERTRAMRLCYLADAPYIHTRRWVDHFVARRRGTRHPFARRRSRATVHYIDGFERRKLRAGPRGSREARAVVGTDIVHALHL
jgi:hypothetical protein